MLLGKVIFNHPYIHLANFIIALGFGETGITTTQSRIIRFSQFVGGVGWSRDKNTSIVMNCYLFSWTISCSIGTNN